MHFKHINNYSNACRSFSFFTFLDFLRNRPLPDVPPENSLSAYQFETNDFPQDAETYFVLYDFDAGNNESQLSVKKGDLICLINVDVQKGMCQGQNKHGIIGWLPYNCIVPRNSLLRFDWYHGKISRHQAENCLLNRGINGSFLMRSSESVPGRHVLSLLHERRIKHYMVHSDENDMVYISERSKFKTLEDLVDFYLKQQIRDFPTKLRYPLKKFYEPPQYGFSPTKDEWEISPLDLIIGQKLGIGQNGEYKAECKKYRGTFAVKTSKVGLKINHNILHETILPLVLVFNSLWCAGIFVAGISEEIFWDKLSKDFSSMFFPLFLSEKFLEFYWLY